MRGYHTRSSGGSILTRLRQRKTRTPRSPKRPDLSRSQLRERRRQMRKLQGAMVLTATGLLVGGMSWLSYLDAVSVRTIVVEGNDAVPAEAIEATAMQATAGAALGLFSRQNMVLYPAGKLENQLVFEYPRIATADVDRSFLSSSATIELVERTPYAQWCRTPAQEECFLVDRTGFIFERLAGTSTQPYTFIGGEIHNRENVLRHYVAPDNFAALVAFLDELSASELRAHTIVLEGVDARVLIEPGWTLRVALDKDLGAAAFNLETVLDEYGLRDRLSSIEYIDVRFGERVYFKTEGEDSESEVAR